MNGQKELHRQIAGTLSGTSGMCAVLSSSVVSNSLQPHGFQATRLLCPWDSPGQNTGVGCHSLLQGIFLIQSLHPGVLHCSQILYFLSHRLLKFMCMESVALSNHLVLSCPHILLPSVFPSIRIFPMNWLFASGGQSIRASASASVLPRNIQS